MKLSIRGYAKHRGVSEGAVRAAIKRGRIIKGENGKIDPIVADRQWQANSDPAQVHSVRGGAEENGDSARGVAEPSYHRSRAIHEAYNARLAKLQYEKESGQWVSLKEVRVNWFNAGRITRDRILNCPDRVIPMLVGKTDIKAMKEILRNELIAALEELSSQYGSPAQS